MWEHARRSPTQIRTRPSLPAVLISITTAGVGYRFVLAPAERSTGNPSTGVAGMMVAAMVTSKAVRYPQQGPVQRTRSREATRAPEKLAQPSKLLAGWQRPRHFLSTSKCMFDTTPNPRDRQPRCFSRLQADSMATVATDTRRDGGDVADDRAPRVSAARARAARRRARLQANAKNRLKFVRGDSAKLDGALLPVCVCACVYACMYMRVFGLHICGACLHQRVVPLIDVCCVHCHHPQLPLRRQPPSCSAFSPRQ